MNNCATVPFLAFFFLFFSNHLSGEDESLHLVHADTTKGKMIDGEHVDIMIGHIHAYQDTIHMFCDLAYRYSNQNRIELFSNVVINDGYHVVRADKIIYDELERRADCFDRVRISSESDSLYAEKFVYYFKDKKADAQENLFLFDKENHVSVWGDKGVYISSRKTGDIYRHAKFQHYETGKNDTLYITAVQLHYEGLEPKRAVAVDSVIIQKGDFYATCDSAYYLISEEKILLRGQPQAWQDDNEMNGDFIDVKLDSVEIHEIYLTENAQIKSLADSLAEKYNLLKGKTIQVSLVDQKPQLVVARKNASSLYLIEDDQKTTGTNAAIADSIILYFYEGQVDSIAILGGVEGAFYPADYEGEIEIEY
jgi:lipopolysaccharide export system protein LptA